MARQSSRLQQEIQQTKPFHSIYQEAALSVMKTADLLRRAVARRLDSHDITPQQYNVLRILRGAGPDGLPTLAIGERLVEEAPGMTRLLDRLDAKGLVRRIRCEHDRRQVLCYLAEPGKRLLSAIDPDMRGAEVDFAGSLTPAEAEVLVELLEKIREPKQ
jgi:DNA-binding MarR family transcriptional regulator